MSRSGSISVDVDIDDVIDEIDDTTLMAEVAARGLSGAGEDGAPIVAYDQWADDIRAAARAGDWTHLDILLWRRRPDQRAGSHVPDLPLIRPQVTQ